MKILFLSSFVFLAVIFHKTEADATLTFGSATKQNPGVTLKAVNNDGRLVQTVTWTFQASQCEVLTRTDESMNSRAILVSLTSTCIHRNVCGIRGPVTTPIPCEEFMRRFN